MDRRIQRQPVIFSLVAATGLLAAVALRTTAAAPPQLTADQQTVLKHISAASLKKHLSYIASDELGGRSTPSTGLDAAAEYIATQFRAAGLEPAGPEGSFYQNATVTVREQNPLKYDVTISSGSGTSRRVLKLDPADTFFAIGADIDLNGVPMIALDGTGPLPSADQVQFHVALVTTPREAAAVAKMNPVLVIRMARQLPSSQVFDPEGRPPTNQFMIAKPELAAFLKGAENLRLDMHVKASRDRKAETRNVAGILRGSDPMLKNSYVMLTAHYDHLPMLRESQVEPGADRIFNGANDDGSGTVSVMEIASALAALPRHPARSILFMTFFGEERSLVGSSYYGRHPLVPLSDTIADLNLEQVGRTDSGAGPQTTNVAKTASITGFDFSDLPKIVADASVAAGVKVSKDSKNSDPYFFDSDNLSLAEFGIPAHTLCVAFDFPDYHKVGDSADKIDYPNMATVDGAIAFGLLKLASSAPPPKWNESVDATKPYVNAAKLLHPAQ